MTPDPIGPATCRAAANLAREALQLLDHPAAADPAQRGEAARMLRSAAFLIHPPTKPPPAPVAPDPAVQLLEAIAAMDSATTHAQPGPPGPRPLRSITAGRAGPTPADVPPRRPPTPE